MFRVTGGEDALRTRNPERADWETMRAQPSPIEEYVAALQHVLGGPWLARRSILQELRDGLTDAADAYRAAGEARLEAERRAIDELGEPADVAAAFHDELAAHTGRQTAWLLLAFSALTFTIANLAWRNGSAEVANVHIPAGYAALARAVDLLGAGTLLSAVVAVAAFGWAARWVGSAAIATRMVGWLVLVTSSAKMLGGTILWLWAPGILRMTFISIVTSGIILLVTAWLALLAARCVAVGSACRA